MSWADKIGGITSGTALVNLCLHCCALLTVLLYWLPFHHQEISTMFQKQKRGWNITYWFFCFVACLRVVLLLPVVTVREFLHVLEPDFGMCLVIIASVTAVRGHELMVPCPWFCGSFCFWSNACFFHSHTPLGRKGKCALNWLWKHQRVEKSVRMSKPSSRISINQDILFLDCCLKDEGLIYSIPWFVVEKRRGFIHFRNLERGWPWQQGEELIGTRFRKILYLSFWVNKSVTETAW